MKICIYAICKNEKQFVSKWLDSMQEADYIVILDTGSTDGTYEMLKADPRVTRVEQEIISPWRFDVARNKSMELVPEDADVLFCTDLDEILMPGWAAAIKESWIPGFHCRGYYKYAWSHNEIGEPENIFWYDKIHTRDYHWEYPVHEALRGVAAEYENTHSIAFDERVFLHHYPDMSKSRGSYLGLLELRVAENPNDFYGAFYLGREYSFYNRFEDSNKTFLSILNGEYNEMKDDLVIAGCYTFVADNYRKMGDDLSAIGYYMKSIQQDKTYREPYLYIAEILNEHKMYRLAVGAVEEGLTQSFRHYNWLERGDTWREKPYDILGISYYYLGNYEKSKENMLKALEYNPTDKRLQYNLTFLN